MDADLAYFDAQVTHHLATVRYSAGVAASVVPLMNPVVASINEVLGQSLGRKRDRKLLVEVYGAVRDSVSAAYGQIGEQLTEARSALSVVEIDTQLALARAYYPAFKVYNAGVQKSLTESVINGHPLAAWIEQGKAQAYYRIAGPIRQGFEDGVNSDAIMRNVRGSDTDPGLVGAVKSNVDLLARMAIMQAASEAKNAFGKANHLVFPYWRFTALLDNKASKGCASLDGEIFPVGEGLRPPRHPGCRSGLIPVRSADFRNAESYEQWLARQSEAVQVDVLGRERADLFAAGKIKLSDLTDRYGKELTLDQLRERV